MVLMEFEYEIRNRIQNKKISTSQIQQRGFTTKKNHKGLGLANIKEIENKYPDMSIFIPSKMAGLTFT